MTALLEADRRERQRWIAEADAGRAAGDLRRAIDALTAANGIRPSPKLEQDLVRLRHEAATASAGPPTTAGPPVTAETAAVPDVFGSVAGPPEVDRAGLSARSLAAGIRHHGCLLVRGLLPPPTVDRLRDDIDRAFDACRAWIDGAPLAETAPWFVPFKPARGYSLGHGRRFVLKGSGVWTVDSPRSLFDLLGALEAEGVLDAVSGYLGERPYLSARKCTLRKVPADSGADWHQDGAFLGAGARTVNVWVTLTSCGGDDGPAGLELVPRRLEDLVERGSEGAWFDWSVGPGVVERVAADTPVIRPRLEPGDALLFDELFLHRTGVGPGTTGERYALETWCFAPSCYPAAQIPVMW